MVFDTSEFAIAQLLAGDKHIELADTDDLLEVLVINDVLTVIDYREYPDAIRNRLEWLSGYPGDIDWSWYRHFVAELPFLDTAEQVERFLELVGEHCRRSDTLLVSVDTYSDSYGLGFVPAERWSRRADLVAAAGSRLSVVGEGWASELGGRTEEGQRRLAELRHAADARRAGMSEWERFTENLAALLGGNPVDMVMILSTGRSTVQVFNEPGRLYVEVLMSALSDGQYRHLPETEVLLAADGWTQRKDVGDPWEYVCAASGARPLEIYQSFAERVVVGLRAVAVASPGDLTVTGWIEYDNAPDLDFSVLEIR